jgi:hypothetical protein
LEDVATGVVEQGAFSENGNQILKHKESGCLDFKSVSRDGNELLFAGLSFR